MNELENIDNINIDDLYNKIVDKIEKAKRNVALKINEEMIFPLILFICSEVFGIFFGTNIFFY